MRPSLVKLVAMILLVVQGVAALAPGRVLCIPVGACDVHDVGGPAACGHTHGDACSVGDDDAGHGPGDHDVCLGVAFHPMGDCGCHVHIPVPSDEQLPCGSRGDSFEVRAIVAPVIVAASLSRAPGPALAVSALFHPPDFSGTDQVLALKSTRLLI